MLRFLPLLALAATSACGSDGGNRAFRASGELIALSGGDGGATNACITCHGLQGEGDGRLTPRLAGLDAGYLHRQLDDFVNGRRADPVMRAVALRLSTTDRAKVSAYYAALPAAGPVLPLTSALYESECAECHGARGEGIGPANPPLAGQPAPYIVAQLMAWRSGKRRGDGMAEMQRVSRALAPAEVHHLADLAAAHPPAPRPVPVQAASR